MKKLKTFSLLPIIIFTLFFQLKCIQKGSDTVISIQPEATFPSSDSNNSMLAFGWFKNGFSLEDASTTCTFESVFPVCGNINMNGGLLNLEADINFNNLANLISSGTFWGNKYLIELSETTTLLTLTTINEGKLFFYNDLTISETLKFQGNCILNGHGSEIYLNNNGKIIIAPNSTLKIQHTTLSGISTNKIICESNSSKLILDSIEWYQDGNYSFTQGSLKIQNTVAFGGGYIFSYESSQTSTIDVDSAWKIFDNSQLSIGRYLATNFIEPLYFEDFSSQLFLDNCTLNITSSGMCISRGSVYCDRDVIIQPNSTTTNNGLILGNGIENEDAIFKFYPGSIIYFENGHITYNIMNQDMLSLKDFQAKLYRDDDNVFNVEQNVNLSNLLIYKSDSSSMPVKEGKYVIYDNCRIEMPNLDFYLTGSRYNDYTNILDSNDELVLNKGNYPALTYVYNDNNSIRGNGTISGPIILSNSNSELNIDLSGLLNTGIILNGSTLNLEHDLYCSQDGGVGGVGKLNLSSFNLLLGNQDVNWTSSIYIDGNNGRIKLNDDLCFSSDVTFSGNCEIEGNGQTVYFIDGCKLTVEKGSTLSFRNISLTGIKENKIICSDNNSKIIFDNTSMNFTGNYTFSIGSFEILNTVDFKGSYTFEYLSSIPSTIHKNSELVISNDITMYLGNNGTITPFTFIDQTSNLKIQNAKFKIGSTGFQLKKGTLSVEGYVNLDISSTSSTNSLIFGTGQKEDDAILKVCSASRVLVESGALVYNNTISDGFRSSSNENRFIRNANTNFYINNDFILKKVKLEISPFSITTIAPEKIFRYDECIVSINGVTFEATGQIYNPYTTLLNGNNEIFIHEGTLPLYLLVQNTNNKLHGAGNISGSIILSNSNSELEICLLGEILNNVQLNSGTVTINNDLEISKDNLIVGPGTVDLTTKNLYLGTRETTWTTPILWNGDDALIKMNSTIDLSETWTFQGNVILDGNDNRLNLDWDGIIFVKEDTTLKLKNLSIKWAGNNKIKCESSTSKIIFDNVTLMLPEGDYEFTNGSFDVLNELDIRGPNTFYYKTDQYSMIHPNSSIVIRKNARFSYAPTCTTDNLLEMSSCSEFILDETTLHSTTTGMKLTKGFLTIKGNCSIESDATCEGEGIKFGDGINEDNDLTVDIEAESTLNLTSGHIVSLNVN